MSLQEHRPAQITFHDPLDTIARSLNVFRTHTAQPCTLGMQFTMDDSSNMSSAALDVHHLSTQARYNDASQNEAAPDRPQSTCDTPAMATAACTTRCTSKQSWSLKQPSFQAHETEAPVSMHLEGAEPLQRLPHPETFPVPVDEGWQRALLEGQNFKVLYYICSGVQMDTVVLGWATPLALAVLTDNVPMAHMLGSAGCDVNKCVLSL